MFCRFIPLSTPSDATEFLSILQQRNSPGLAEEAARTEQMVLGILQAVRTNGLKAVVKYTQKFDAPEFTESMFAVSEQEIANAAASIPIEDAQVIQEAAANIRAFHEKQRQSSWFTHQPDGTILGQMVTPVDRAGLYIPGGKGGSTPLISSMLMNVIPAQVAGVKDIAVISPPMKDGTVNKHILAAAHFLGVREVYAAGSAWAIAALAYGAGPCKPVDVIAGPGNIFVTTAKRLLIGTVGIDMLAGPSEILIIADETANPAWIAADMLSQAEHDTLASAVCLCTNENIARQTLVEIARQCEELPRKDVARQSLEAYGAIMFTPTLDMAVTLANIIAPEHLELLVADPWSVVSTLRHAGAIFMGHYTAEPMGDYFAGPNHVLPTMGTARFSSALGVDTFIKKTSLIAASETFTQKAADSIARLARLEGLEAHARSALCRKR